MERMEGMEKMEGMEGVEEMEGMEGVEGATGAGVGAPCTARLTWGRSQGGAPAMAAAT